MSRNLPANPFDSEYTEQTDATLALAYEQRTANLIALFSLENVAEVNYGYLRNQIIKRLGLAATDG